MEENKKLEAADSLEPITAEEESSFDLRTIYTLVVLNWQWFALSIIIFLSAALLYLRYADPVYSISAKRRTRTTAPSETFRT